MQVQHTHVINCTLARLQTHTDIFGRLFVKRFALRYLTVSVLSFCLSCQ